MARSREPDGSIALALGPAAAVLIAGALSGVREDLGTTNVALIMACVVVLAALAGRRAGGATAVVAAISYNFFHTQPYQSLRINGGKDMITVVLLAVLGVVVSEMAQRRRRASESEKAHVQSEGALELVAARLADDSAAEVVWADVHSSLIEILDLAECRFEPGERCPLATLPRSGSLFAKEMHWSRRGFVLPAEGAALRVGYGGRTFGHIVLVPRGDSGTSIEARRVALGLADQYAVALELQSHQRAETSDASSPNS